VIAAVAPSTPTYSWLSAIKVWPLAYLVANLETVHKVALQVDILRCCWCNNSKHDGLLHRRFAIATHIITARCASKEGLLCFKTINGTFAEVALKAITIVAKKVRAAVRHL